MSKRLPLAMIPENVVLGSPVHDQQNKLLLGAGVTITRKLLSELHKRGVRTVVVAEGDWVKMTAFASKGKLRNALPNRNDARSNIESRGTRQLDGALDENSFCGVVPSDDPFSERVVSHGATRYDREKMDQLVDQHQQSVDQVSDILEQLNKDQTVASTVLEKITHEALTQATEDLDLFVCMGINPLDSNSVFEHSTNVATLAIAIGSTLGLDEESLCQLGMGCLIHDVGMLRIDKKMYESDQVLQANEFVEIAKHSVISTDMLYENMEQVPLGVRMVVYQMHERCDGSGYPRGCSGEQIHPLAKIAGVADTYVALVSSRPHRHAMLPYYAVAKILNDVQAGLFDSKVVRGLLHTISLFPTGSYVELSDRQVAKVIRSNGSAYDRPVVEAWKQTRLSAMPAIIDLMEEDLNVVKPLTSLQ